MTFFEVDDILSPLEACYYIPTRGGKDGMNAIGRRFTWYTIFKEYDYEDVKKATIVATKIYKIFPSIADIIKILEYGADILEGLL